MIGLDAPGIGLVESVHVVEVQEQAVRLGTALACKQIPVFLGDGRIAVLQSTPKKVSGAVQVFLSLLVVVDVVGVELGLKCKFLVLGLEEIVDMGTSSSAARRVEERESGLVDVANRAVDLESRSGLHGESPLRLGQNFECVSIPKFDLFRDGVEEVGVASSEVGGAEVRRLLNK